MYIFMYILHEWYQISPKLSRLIWDQFDILQKLFHKQETGRVLLLEGRYSDWTLVNWHFEFCFLEVVIGCHWIWRINLIMANALQFSLGNCKPLASNRHYSQNCRTLSKNYHFLFHILRLNNMKYHDSTQKWSLFLG